MQSMGMLLKSYSTVKRHEVMAPGTKKYKKYACVPFTQAFRVKVLSVISYLI